ncbi:MAG: cell wall surface anchor family protein [Parcubacteria group bacterium Athens1014_10]|nr:MAG: cell wall surface anchor family protein [Parcubacteria group bacterium Athens1014_10]TSD04803.1 MAG: cell wall surface anchor family protein [Parcubacteria group bacterium Athens0714_12]
MFILLHNLIIKINNTSHMKKTISFFFLALCLMLSPFFVFAQWNEPSLNPPLGNVDAPVNVGTGAQDKQGALTILGNSSTAKGFMVGSNALILQAGENLIYGNIDSTSVGNLLLLQNENVTKLVVTKDGNVGIGITAPTHKLELATHTTATGGIAFGTDVELYRSAANTLTLPPGDSLNLVSGSLQAAGTQVITSGRLVQAANGTAAGPGFSFSADTNTGMYSGGVDILRFSTAGADRMTILANGDVGIGTTAPGYKLDVQGGQINASGGLCINGDCKASWAAAGGGYWTQSGSNLYPQNTAWNVGIGTTAPASKLMFGNGESNVDAIRMGSEGRYGMGFNTNAGGYFNIWAHQTATRIGIGFDTGSYGTFSEKLTILASTGNVGIGTTDPRSNLTIVTGIGGQNTAGDVVYAQLISSEDRAFNTASGQLFIQSNSDMAVDRGGSIAFGGRYLAGSTAGAGWAGIRGGKNNSTSGEYGGYLAFATRLHGSVLTERMRITTDGNVGIGTTAPGAKLDINSGGTTKMLLGANTSNTAYNAISLNGDNADGSRIGFTGGGSADTRLYIDSTGFVVFRSGNVGIGTGAPSEKLDVSGNIKASGDICTGSRCLNSIGVSNLKGATLVYDNRYDPNAGPEYEIITPYFDTQPVGVFKQYIPMLGFDPDCWNGNARIKGESFEYYNTSYSSTYSIRYKFTITQTAGDVINACVRLKVYRIDE